jgi:hypothetical protein
MERSRMRSLKFIGDSEETSKANHQEQIVA